MNRKERLETGLENLFSSHKVTPQPESPAANPIDALVGAISEIDVEDVDPETNNEAAVEAEDSAEFGVERLVEPQHEPPIATKSPTPRQIEPDPSPHQDQDDQQQEIQLVVFTLDGERYGVDIDVVNSIIKLQAITAVPRASQFIEGVTNLRGTVLPVVDLRRRFDMPAQPASKDSRIVVIEVKEISVGMIVDGVNEVLRIPASAIEPPSPIITTLDSTFIVGIAKANEHMIVILDLVKVLNIEKRVE